MTTVLSLALPIRPGKGVGDLALGTPAADVLAAVFAADAADIEVQAHYPRLFEYRYRESLCLFIDIVTARLVRIDLEPGYVGTYDGVGVGSSVGELRALRSDLSWDEEWVIVGEFDMSALVDGVEVVSSIDDHLDSRIGALSIELAGWAAQ